MQSCVSDAFDLFSLPPVNVGILSEETVELLPISASLNDTSIEFVVPPETSRYIDLANTFIKIAVNITSEKNFTASTSLIPLFPHAVFRQVDLYLNQKLVSTATDLYAYRAFLENLCLPVALQEHETRVLEYSDGQTLPTEEKSATYNALIPIHLDLMNQSRLLLNGVELKLRLTRHQDLDKLLILETTANQAKVTIAKMLLFIHKIHPSPTVLLRHEQELRQRNAVYPIDRVWVKTHNLTKGTKDFVISNCYLGTLPNRILVGFVRSNAYNGSTSHSPFKFEPFDVCNLALSVNGVQVPFVALTPTFKTKDVVRSYHSLIDTVLGDSRDTRSLGISKDDYCTKTALFGFRLQPQSGGASAVTQTGTVSLRILFADPLPENVTTIIYGEFQNRIEIDSSRTVHTDFGT
jgi:hypothetical protein